MPSMCSAPTRALSIARVGPTDVDLRGATAELAQRVSGPQRCSTGLDQCQAIAPCRTRLHRTDRRSWSKTAWCRASPAPDSISATPPAIMPIRSIGHANGEHRVVCGGRLAKQRSAVGKSCTAESSGQPLVFVLAHRYEGVRAVVAVAKRHDVCDSSSKERKGSRDPCRCLADHGHRIVVGGGIESDGARGNDNPSDSAVRGHLPSNGVRERA